MFICIHVLVNLFKLIMRKNDIKMGKKLVSILFLCRMFPLLNNDTVDVLLIFNVQSTTCWRETRHIATKK